MYAVVFIALAGLGLAVFFGWLYHKRTESIIARYERMIEDMFDRKMAQGNYETYVYGKSLKNKQQIVEFLDELEKGREDRQIPLQMESNRG